MGPAISRHSQKAAEQLAFLWFLTRRGPPLPVSSDLIHPSRSSQAQLVQRSAPSQCTLSFRDQSLVISLCFLPNRILNWALSFTCHNCFASFLQLDSKLIKGQDSSGWALGVISSFWVQAQGRRGCTLVSWSSPLRWDLYGVPGDLARAPAPCLGHTEAPQNFSQDEPWVPMFRKGKPCCQMGHSVKVSL